MNISSPRSFVRCLVRRGVLLAALFLVVTAKAAAPEPGRFLLVFETSPTVKKNLPAVKQTLDVLFASNLQHEMQDNDDLAVWTVDQDLHTGTFPLASWSPEDAEMYSARLKDFLGRQKYTRHASLAAVQPLLNRVVKNSERLTILIFCDSESRLLGTPYDSGVNEIIQKSTAEAKGVPGLFIIALRSYRGEYLGGSVNRSAPVNFPKFPPPPKPEPPPVSKSPPVAAPAAAPLPAPVPAPLPALIIIGTNVAANAATNVTTNLAVVINPAAQPVPQPAPPPVPQPTAQATPQPMPQPAINAPVVEPAAPAPKPVAAPPAIPAPVAIPPALVTPAPAPVSNPPALATPMPTQAPNVPRTPAPEPIAKLPAVPAPEIIAPTNPLPPITVVATSNSAFESAAAADTAADSGFKNLILLGGGLLVTAVSLVVWLMTRSRGPRGSLITSSMQDDPRLPPRK